MSAQAAAHPRAASAPIDDRRRDAAAEATQARPALSSPGQGLVASVLAPGHYATDVYYDQTSSCSQSWNAYSAHGSLLLDLSRDGSAAACRGRHVANRGPGYAEEMMEQQGFRGSWHLDGPWLDVRLELSDGPDCPQLRGYTNREPAIWHLRCVSLTPGGGAPGAAVALPVAGCQFAEEVYSEKLGYVVSGLLDGEWILLAAGSGLLVSSSQPYPHERVSVDVRPALSPVVVSSWRAGFVAPR